MINFCTDALGTKISLLGSRAEEDGFEVENLLKYPKKLVLTPSLFNSPTNPNSAFICSTFARAPVSLKVQFPCPIDLSHIVICPKVGQQWSTAFVIETHVLPKPKDKNDEGLVRHEISREFLNDKNNLPELVLFKNQRFTLRRDFNRLPQTEANARLTQEHMCSFNIRHKGCYNSGHDVMSLTITIQRANRIPCLGLLEVWGQPSLSNSRERVDEILRLWNNCLVETKPDSPVEPQPKRPRLEDSCPSSSNSKIKDGVSIPEEFLDPITFELMVQPIRLPCGIAIDSQTLDTYHKEEEKWGRPKNDPFTSCPFSETCHPVPDLSLKARIDMFLTRHANNQLFSNIPRTLGAGNGINRESTSQKFQNEPNTSGTNEISSIERQTNRILASSTKTANCIKCGPNKNKPEIRIQYSPPCKHFIICRNCLLTIDKNNENICHFCKSVWFVKDVVREYV